MKISNELEAQILRYYHVEKWRVGTIARQLNVHHSVVRRVLSQAGIPKTNFIRRESIITPYLSFILETLAKYPRLAASRLYEMVKIRGFNGGVDHFRHVISLHRPQPPAEAYLRLRTLPGEQAQVDWGHFGYVEIGKAKRPLMAFVMVLSYSRKIFLRFYLNQQMANFLRGHEAAFNEWKGVPRVCLYDNLKSAVLERRGDAIRFNPILLEFAGHYRYEPRPVAVARGNEKGRVERAIRYVRDNFFAARTWENIDDLNQQAHDWCHSVAADRLCPEDKTLSVQEAFLFEKPKLLSLPTHPYHVDEREEVNVGKTPYVRFDLNDYSVPHQYVRRILTVHATLTEISILDGTTVIAEHSRCYERGKQIEQTSHIEDLMHDKKSARQHRGQDRLIHAVPVSKILLNLAAERGYSLGMITAQLLKLLDSFGANELEIAMNEALSRDVPHPNAVRVLLEKRREEQNLFPPITIDLPNDERVRDLVVRPHDLKSYDQLKSIDEEKNNDQ
jgi:transposase